MSIVQFFIKPYVRMVFRILTWVIYIATIISAYGGYIPPKIWSIPSIFTLALPYLAGLTIICALCWVLSRRLIMAGLGVVTIIICSGPVLTAMPVGFRHKAEPDKPVYTLLTYNITHGTDMRQKDLTRSTSFDYVMKTDADIVVLQEINAFDNTEIQHFPASMRDSLFAQYPYRIASEVSHLGILSKFPVKVVMQSASTERWMSKFVVYELNVQGKPLHIANCHLSSYMLTDEERKVVTDVKGPESAKRSLSEFKGSILTKLKESFRERSDDASQLREELNQINGPLIVCGDFNDVPASWAYRTIIGDDLKDAWRETCFGATVTFNRHLFLFHIDQILYRGDLQFLKVKRGRLRSSDHYPLTAEFQFTD